MKKLSDEVLSWGRTFRFAHEVRPMHSGADFNHARKSSTPLLAHGCGRSYGDVCLNENAQLLLTFGLNRFLSFERQTGLLRCEAGVTLGDILRFCVPLGWFLPVVPGTKYVTLGGAIANDVHGKNHHHDGSFGCHVERFELLRSDGKRLVCSRFENSDYFFATLGGIGLTGLITWAELKLKKISNAFLNVENIKLRSIDDFFKVTSDSDNTFTYTVTWVDSTARGRRLGRGLFMRANNREEGSSLKLHHAPRWSVPIDMPEFLLNRWSIKAFNSSYYYRVLKQVTSGMQHYDPFFFPLDKIKRWNLLYGRRGFYQYQFLVPEKSAETIARVLELVAHSMTGSFLTVLKQFGSVRSGGLLSFPDAGYTLTLDIPNSATSEGLFKKIDQIVMESNGRIYLAKDARMPPEMFRAGYPNVEKFKNFKDPKFSSSLWRRLTGEQYEF